MSRIFFSGPVRGAFLAVLLCAAALLQGCAYSAYGLYDDQRLMDTITDAKGVNIARSYRPRSVTPHWFSPASSDTSNLALATSLRADLISAKGLSSTRIDTEVNAGRVVLLGVVRDDAEKRLAISVARKLKGVTSVTSYLMLPQKPYAPQGKSGGPAPQGRFFSARGARGGRVRRAQPREQLQGFLHAVHPDGGRAVEHESRSFQRTADAEHRHPGAGGQPDLHPGVLPRCPVVDDKIRSKAGIAAKGIDRAALPVRIHPEAALRRRQPGGRRGFFRPVQNAAAKGLEFAPEQAHPMLVLEGAGHIDGQGRGAGRPGERGSGRVPGAAFTGVRGDAAGTAHG